MRCVYTLCSDVRYNNLITIQALDLVGRDVNAEKRVRGAYEGR